MRIVRFGMRIACLALAFLLSACGSSAPLPPPVIEAPPAPPVVIVEEPQPEVEEAVDVEPIVVPPPPDPPRLSIREQSVYPAVDLYEWTLSNGATVVYKRVGAPGPLRLLAFARGGWTSLDPGEAALAVLDTPGSSDDGLSLGATERQIRARAGEVRPLIQSAVDAMSGRQSLPAPPRTAVDALDPIGIEVARPSPNGTGPRAPSIVPDELTIVIVGDVDPAYVVAEAGRTVARIRSAPDGLAFGRARPSPARPSPARPSPARPSPARPSPARPSPARPSPARPSRVVRSGENGALDLALRAPLGRAGVAALGVVRIALEDALTNAGLGRLRVEAAPTPWTDAGWLRVVVESSDLDPDELATRVRAVLESPSLDLASARTARRRQLSDPAPDEWLEAVADLYREGGGTRPGRNPAALDPLSASIEQVSLDDLRSLARRFAVSEDAALILMP